MQSLHHGVRSPGGRTAPVGRPALACALPAYTVCSSSSSHISSLTGGVAHAVCPYSQNWQACSRLLPPLRGSVISKAAGGSGKGKPEEEADWEAEMSIFKKRISRPNQLATLRELEAKVNVGKVLYIQSGLAVVSGLNQDAPLGTKLTFVTGAIGVLLWHRSDNLSFCLALGGSDEAPIAVGTPVECKIKGVLQVVDEVKGPITRKDFEPFLAPAGDELFGLAVDYLGRPQLGLMAAAAGAPAPSAAADSAAAGLSKTRPLMNPQVAMKDRDQINECLLTGVKALDILTPLGRGASLLVIGPHGSGKSALALDALLAQAPGQPGFAKEGSGVKSVLALLGRPAQQVQAIVKELYAAGAMANTCVIAVEEGAPLAHQYAAMCLACSLGERVRDEGGHSLVVVDDIKPLADTWEQLVAGLVGLGGRLLREGLVKDDNGRDVAVPEAASAGGTGSMASVEGSSDEALVEYQGMLVSGAVAQRRGFLSTFFMRAAKLSRANGGGSMTLLPLVPGACATGVSKRIDMSKYQTLTEDQKRRIEAALKARAQAELAASGGDVAPGELVTEVVEEFISIADGQVVLQGPAQRSQAAGYEVNPKLSITRIGTRAYYKALETLAPQVRLDLAQAEDARRFLSINGSQAPGQQQQAQQAQQAAKADVLARRISAALLQAPGRPSGLAEQVVMLYAVQRGFADDVAPEVMAAWVKGAVTHVQAVAPAALQEVVRTNMLTATAEQGIREALQGYRWQREQLAQAQMALQQKPAA